ncbi:hypothetical protein [Methylomonas rhizoryzae]|uniref:hypothetical protein n=1 Tax=Methylomonas rhizoryzae TaxID=2608981 RepID=UPI001E5BEFBA|nr:hypothetical protein [Methylomonas rhizoryzae]
MLNAAQLKSLSVFAIFAIVGFGPISPGCLIGMFIVAKRPDWFRRLVRGIYDYPHDIDFVTAAETRGARIKTFASLATLFVIDIAPVPVTPVVAFAIILSRPRWFYRTVRRIYGQAI